MASLDLKISGIYGGTRNGSGKWSVEGKIVDLETYILNFFVDRETYERIVEMGRKGDLSGKLSITLTREEEYGVIAE